MSTKPLKSIKFPGLPDTYTVPEAFILSTTFTAAEWSADGIPYTQTVYVPDILETDTPIVDIDLSNEGDVLASLEAWGCIGRITTQNGAVTAYCYDNVPEVNITVTMKVVR